MAVKHFPYSILVQWLWDRSCPELLENKGLWKVCEFQNGNLFVNFKIWICFWISKWEPVWTLTWNGNTNNNIHNMCSRACSAYHLSYRQTKSTEKHVLLCTLSGCLPAGYHKLYYRCVCYCLFPLLFIILVSVLTSLVCECIHHTLASVCLKLLSIKGWSNLDK